jgi:hypothetical protein
VAGANDLAFCYSVLGPAITQFFGHDYSAFWPRFGPFLGILFVFVALAGDDWGVHLGV